MKSAAPNQNKYNVVGAIFIPCFAINWQEVIKECFIVEISCNHLFEARLPPVR